MIEKMFHKLVDEVRKELPEFGTIRACDGKAIATHVNGRKRWKMEDGRRDTEGIGVRKTI
jgi:hypothetical protein